MKSFFKLDVVSYIAGAELTNQSIAIHWVRLNIEYDSRPNTIYCEIRSIFDRTYLRTKSSLPQNLFTPCVDVCSLWTVKHSSGSDWFKWNTTIATKIHWKSFCFIQKICSSCFNNFRFPLDKSKLSGVLSKDSLLCTPSI